MKYKCPECGIRNAITTTPVVECTKAEYRCKGCGYYNMIIEYYTNDAFNKLKKDLTKDRKAT